MTSPTSSFWRELDTPLLLSLFLVVLCVLAFVVGGPAAQRTVSELLIRIVLVASLHLFIGHSGLMSFGHVAFMCVGAYGAAWLSVPAEMKAYTLPGLPDWVLTQSSGHVVSVLGAAGLAAVLALLAGLVLMRLSGIAISIATFALLAVVNVVFSNWESGTGGTSSVVGIPTEVDLWTALAWACAVLVLVQLYGRSAWGMQLRALREDSVAARASGVNLYTVALLAFTLSGALMGLGGALQAQFLGVVNPDAFYLGQTFLLIAMLVLGGSASLTGAVCVVVVTTLLVELLICLEQGVTLAGVALRAPGGTQEVVVGMLMVVVLVFRPQGLMGSTEWRLGRAGR